MKQRPALVVAICVGAVVAVLIILLATSSSDPDRAVASPVVGKTAPSFDANDVDGRVVSVEDYQGKWLLVNFFATWCIPCKAEQPELVTLSSSMPIVSIAFDDPVDKVKDSFADNGGDWPVIAEGDGRLALDYGVVKLPESYLVNPDGKVVKKFDGGITASEVQHYIATAK